MRPSPAKSWITLVPVAAYYISSNCVCLSLIVLVDVFPIHSYELTDWDTYATIASIPWITFTPVAAYCVDASGVWMTVIGTKSTLIHIWNKNQIWSTTTYIPPVPQKKSYESSLFNFWTTHFRCVFARGGRMWVPATTLHLRVESSTTGYTRKSGIILLYFYCRALISSITTLLVNFGRSFSFRSTAISYTDFVSLVPPDKRSFVGRNDR